MQARIPDSVNTKDDLLRLLSQEGVSNFTCAAFFGENAQAFEHVRRLCSEVFGERFELKVSSEDQRVVVAATFSLPETYFRALAKIGFHSFLKFFPNFTGFEAEFEGIKRFVYSGGHASAYVTSTMQQIVPDVARLKTCAHILSAEWKQDFLETRMQFFAGLKAGMRILAGSREAVQFDVDPQRLPLVWVVRLGKNPSQLYYTENRGFAFVFYQKPIDGFHGEMSELTAIRNVRPARLFGLARA